MRGFLGRLRGMHEIMDYLNVSETQIGKLNFTTIQTKIIQCANVSSVPSSSGDSNTYRYG
jgi:predicted glycosyltransferase